MNNTSHEYVSASPSIYVQRGPFEMIPHWLLDQPDLTSHAIRLYLVLRSFGDENRASWPGRSLLARRLGVSPSTISRAINDLEVAGAICYKNRPGEGKQMQSNMYHIHWSRNDECDWFTTDGPRPPMTDPSPPVAPPSPYVDYPPPPVAGELIPKEPIPSETDIKRTRVRKPVDDHDPLFEEFWLTYPRRSAKGAARRAWSRASTVANPQAIIAGAARYAGDPNRDDTYTAHPATWLNAERWDDDPLPVRDNRSDRKVDEVKDVIRRAAERDAAQAREIES
jgi:DNA-binding transcriptional ArsR family regulator